MTIPSHPKQPVVCFFLLWLIMIRLRSSDPPAGIRDQYPQSSLTLSQSWSRSVITILVVGSIDADVDVRSDQVILSTLSTVIHIHYYINYIMHYAHTYTKYIIIHLGVGKQSMNLLLMISDTNDNTNYLLLL